MTQIKLFTYTHNMKNLFVFIFTSITLLLPINSFGQEESKIVEKGEFYGDLFLGANFNLKNNQMSYRFNRLHFAYKHNFSEKLYFNGMIESAKEDYALSGSYNGITNLFEFCLGYQSEKLDAKFGLIGTELNQMQEKLWRNRNIDKVFADKYGFAPTNDLGFILKYKPYKFISLDFAMTNGEGHKSIQTDSAFRYSIGSSFTKNAFYLRAYTDFIYTNDFQQTNFIGIAGYQTSRLSLAAEFNQQYNSGGVTNSEKYGLSAYFDVNITKKIQLFSRYDYIRSNKLSGQNENWNIANDGDLIIAGFEYNIRKGIDISPNYRIWLPDDGTKENSFVFLNLKIEF